MSLSASMIDSTTGQRPTTGILAVADLVQGSQGLYTVAVAIIALFCLIAGGIGGAGALGSGRIGTAVGSILAGIMCAVLIGSSYAIYVSTKTTVDHHTGITSGQFG